MNRPVALDQGDIAGDGRVDLVVCHDYAKTMFEATPADGQISWLRNPGGDGDEEWEVRSIGQLGSTHRLRLGHFADPDRLDLLALPVVGPRDRDEALHFPIQVKLYSPPATCSTPAVGRRAARRLQLPGHPRRRARAATERLAAGLDATLLACEEGLCWFGYTEQGGWQARRWSRARSQQKPDTGYAGSGNVAIGRIGDDPFALHRRGRALPRQHARPLHARGGGWPHRAHLDPDRDRRLRRAQRGRRGPGSITSSTADFDGDGDDEFLVAMRGPEPHQGVMYYKPTDLAAAASTGPGSRPTPPRESPSPTSTATAASTSPRSATTYRATSSARTQPGARSNRFGEPVDGRAADPVRPARRLEKGEPLQIGLSISSPAFEQDSRLPDLRRCGLSPPLEGGGVPEGTRQRALVCHDPDAPLPHGSTN